MQALFSSFYANPCRDSAKPKMATNGGLKPFLGIFSCNLLLRFGEIPICSLYNVAHFWKVCPSPFLWAFCFVRFFVKSFLFRGKAWRSCPYFRSVTKILPQEKSFSRRRACFPAKFCPFTGGLSSRAQAFASLAPEGPAQLLHRVGGEAPAVLLAIGVENRTGSQGLAEGRRQPPDALPLPQRCCRF